MNGFDEWQTVSTVPQAHKSCKWCSASLWLVSVLFLYHHWQLSFDFASHFGFPAGLCIAQLQLPLPACCQLDWTMQSFCANPYLVLIWRPWLLPINSQKCSQLFGLERPKRISSIPPDWLCPLFQGHRKSKVTNRLFKVTKGCFRRHFNNHQTKLPTEIIRTYNPSLRTHISELTSHLVNVFHFSVIGISSLTWPQPEVN
jgi:hypothetical protein